MTTLSQFHCARGEGKSKEIWQHGKTSSTFPNGIKGGEEGGSQFFLDKTQFSFFFFLFEFDEMPRRSSVRTENHETIFRWSYTTL